MATAEAIEAMEVAAGLEAEAKLRAMEALATIELAKDVEAGVVARTVLGLVEAGVVDQGDLADAMAAVLQNEIH
ncbi:MAG: hypothetical protein KJN63_05585 [Acidimicrobiia bacterium]|nr:hypothetical protein [Acidimicrobiia bacterium]